MAKEHQIKISSDITGVTKGINEISKGFKKLGDLKIGTNLKGADVKNALKDQKEVIISTQKEIARLSIELTKAMDDKKVKILRDQIRGLKEDIKSSKNLIGDIQGNTGLGNTRGANRLASIGGGSSGISAGVIAGGAVLAAGVITKLITSLVAPSFEAASSRVRLRGLGVGQDQLNQIERSGVGYGFSASDSRTQAESLLRTTGSTNQLGDFQSLSRGTGLDIEQLIGVGGSLRNSGFNNKQSAQFIKDTLAGAVAAGFDKSRSVDVLTSIADKTEALSQNRNVDPNVVSDLVTRTISGSSYFQQNTGRAFGAVNGLNSLFTGGGTGTGLAYQSLSQLYKGQNRSPIDLLYQSRQGLFNSKDAPERISAYLQNLISQTTNKTVVGGGGLNQLNDDQLKSTAITLTDLVKKSGGNVSDDTSKEIIEGFLTKTGPDRDKFLADKAKETESIEKQTVDYLKSSDNSLLKMSSTLEDIKLLISDGIVANLNKILDFLGISDNGGGFTKRLLNSFTPENPFKIVHNTDNYEGQLDPNLSFLEKIKLSIFDPDSLKSRSVSSANRSSSSSQPVASSTNDSALTTPSSPTSSPYSSSKYKPLSDEALKKIGLDDKAIERFRKYDPLIVAASQKYGVDANTARAVVFNESRFRPEASAFNKRLNLPGGKGLFQFTGGTGKEYGLNTPEDRFDPVKSTDAGVRYLRDLLKKNKGNFAQAIKGYVDPADVGGYTNKVTKDYNKFSAAQNQANIDQYSIFDTISDTVADLNKTLKGMQEKQKKEPVIKSDISNAAKMAFNQSETITGK